MSRLFKKSDKSLFPSITGNSKGRVGQQSTAEVSETEQ